MIRYLFKRLLFIIPTLLVILLINFVVIHVAPGGPVEQAIHQAENFQAAAGQPSSLSHVSSDSQYRGAQGLSNDMIEKIEQQYGFDRPIPERFWLMLKNYLHFDFGSSFFKDKPVVYLIVERMPVTVSLGLWSALFIYLISIPLGIKKARQHGMVFDRMTSFLLAIGYAVPPFVFALMFITFFAGGSYWQWFPLQGLVSENFESLSLFGKIQDYLWHMALPLLTMLLGSFAGLTYLTKYSFMEEQNKPYVLTARAKGLSEKRVLYKHVFRNAILVVIAGLPEALVGIFLIGNVFIEIIFNLNGLGLLGFEAIQQRDYPVIFGTLFIFTLVGLILRLIGDVLYQIIDPRISFENLGAK